ncbi:MAG: polysaccharide biosynthesis protein [Phycisphaeraceae bacterium]
MSAAQLQHTLALASPRPRIVGCLLPHTIRPEGEAGTTVRSLGAFDQIADVIGRERVELVLVSLPLAMDDAMRRLRAQLERLGVTWRFMPTLADQLAGRTAQRHLGDGPPTGPASPAMPGSLDAAQLINRQPRPLDHDAIRHCLAGRCVLITGAGGSIGSELARIVCRFKPAKLVLLERSENALFEIDRELARIFPELPRKAVLHDVTHRQSTFERIGELAPDVIFHAAAHKHVPMMEDHPAAAVENNFYGTRALADAADAHGVQRFVMISSDKAVNPSSVMGATKRLAELYIQHLNQHSDTVYSMVRFGNVLGSACSVLPIWTNQLAHGGPITVTHPDMTRYFMTIPEAAGLVLQAGALSGAEAGRLQPHGQGGEVFLLDMGEPVHIVDLARRFLRAHGYEPDVDIAITHTGIRPGEKLFEELAYDGEDMLPTPHDAIRIWRTTPPSPARMRQIVATFDHLRDGGGDLSHPWQHTSRDAIVTALRTAIPEMVAAAAG